MQENEIYLKTYGIIRNTLKKGDIVQLQTGSPNMNVVGFSCGDVLCKWISDNGTPCSDMFPIECLKIGEIKEKYLIES